MILLTFTGFYKVVLINVIAILMVSNKMVTQGLFIPVSCNKGHDVIIYVCDATSNVLSRD